VRWAPSDARRAPAPGAADRASHRCAPRRGRRRAPPARPRRAAASRGAPKLFLLRDGAPLAALPLERSDVDAEVACARALTLRIEALSAERPRRCRRTHDAHLLLDAWLTRHPPSAVLDVAEARASGELEERLRALLRADAPAASLPLVARAGTDLESRCAGGARGRQRRAVAAAAAGVGSCGASKYARPQVESDRSRSRAVGELAAALRVVGADAPRSSASRAR